MQTEGEIWFLKALVLVFVTALTACQANKSKFDQTITNSIEPLNVKSNTANFVPDQKSKHFSNISPRIFGTSPIKFGGGKAIARNRKVLASLDSGLLSENCSNRPGCDSPMLGEFRSAIEKYSGQSKFQAINQVNRLVNNALIYQMEGITRPEIDHWQSFSETIGSGSGDCEDFALVKRAILVRMGYSEESMFVSVVKDRDRGLYHAVLVVKSDSEYFILDNLADTVLEDKFYTNYMPIYSLTSSQTWIHGVSSNRTIG